MQTTVAVSNMNHDKETVLKAAEGMWQPIIQALVSVDGKIFNRKHQACPSCGGKDRFRYEPKYEFPFLCNNCGPKTPLQFLMDLSGMDFPTAINTIGDYLNCVPVEQIRVANQQAQITASFPSWYKFDMDKYKQIKDGAKVGISPWQRVSGLNVLDILKHGDNALIPLLNEHGKAVDFTMIDIDGNWQTTGGNKSAPSGFHSVFGETKGKHTYIAVNPFHAAHAAVFTQRQVICCYSLENIWEIGKNFEEPPVVIVSNIAETKEADSVKFSQLVFNSKNNTVNRRLYQPGEIMKERGNQNE